MKYPTELKKHLKKDKPNTIGTTAFTLIKSDRTGYPNMQKNFKAGLATADPNFPLSAWDKLIPQANITLDLLQNA